MIYRVTRKLTRRELPSETTDGFDYALDVVVERTEVGRWYPVLLMHRGANCSNRILAKELRLNLESQDIAGPSRRFVFRVPVAGDLCCVFFIRNRIKKRLLGQPRRESPETRCLDQFLFPLPDRPVQDRQFHTSKDTSEPRTQLRPPRQRQR